MLFASAQEKIGLLYFSNHKKFKTISKILSNNINSNWDVEHIHLDKNDPQSIVKNIYSKKINYVFALGGQGLQIAGKSQLPGVYALIFSSFENGLVDELNQYKTSLIGLDVSIDPKIQLELISAYFPSIKNIGFVYDPKKTSNHIAHIKNCANKTGHKIISQPVKNSMKVLESLQKMKNKIDMVMLLFDQTVVNNVNFANILKFSLINKIPLIGLGEYMTNKGALMSFHVPDSEIAIQAADLVNEKLFDSNERPKQLVYLKNTHFSVNLAVADIMKIKIPEDVLKKASKIYDEIKN